MYSWFLGAVLFLSSLNLVYAAPTFPLGSRIGLVPAEGMRLSTRSGDFENPAKFASVRLKEMKPDEYALLEASIMNPDEKAFRVIFRERTTIGGYPAVLATVNQASQYGILLRKWLLAVREPTLTMYVVVQSIDSPEGYSDAAIRRMLNSVVARSVVPIEKEMAELPFEIGDRVGFRPVKLDSQSLTMTEGPSNDLYLLEQPVISASITRIEPPKSSETEKFAERLFKTDPEIKDVTVKQSQSFQYHGRARHEIIGQGKDRTSGKPLIVLQTLEFDPRGILRIISITSPSQKEAHLPRFRAFADGVELKRY